MRKVFTIVLLCAGLVFAANDKPSDLKQDMAMFALMNNYNAAEKDIGQKVSATFNVDTALIQELLNAANGTSAVFRFLPAFSNGIVVDVANLDIYVDDSLNVVLFDLRKVPPAR